MRNSFINHIGYGSNGVYVGIDEPKNESVALWIDPTQEREGPGFVPAPTTAQVGQVMAVQAVDLSNRPIAWQPISVSGNGTIEISSSVFFVNVTENDGVLVADHYFEEISEILDKNQLVLCKYGNNEYRLISRVSSYVTFGNLTGAVNAQIRIGKKTAADPVTVVKTNLIPAPEQAKPGQVLGVKSVDSTGALITWGPVDMVAGGSGGAGWQLIGEVETTEPVSSVSITGDTVFTEIIALMTVPPIPEDTGGTTYVRPVLKTKGKINANVGFNKPNTFQQREFWYINRNWGIRQYWPTGANTVASVVASLSPDTISELTNEFNNGGGIIGFHIDWNQNNTFPAGVKMQVWGR